MQGKITKFHLDRLTPKEKDFFLCDIDLKGFGVKTTPQGRKVYVVQYRAGGRGSAKRYTIGTHGTWTPDTARKEAQRLLQDISQGKDPAHSKAVRKQTPTLKDLAAQYLTEYAEPHKKPRSVAEDRRNLENHILPALGSRQVDTLTHADIAKLHHALRRTPVAGNRTLALISTILQVAEEWGVRPEHSNPCRHVKRYKEQQRKRFLSDDELARLGQVFRQADQGKSGSVAAILLLLFTGCRLNEILTLKWSDVDLSHGFLHLPDSKTGQKDIPLNSPARAILKQLPHLHENPYVLPGKRPGHHLTRIHAAWFKIREAAQLQNVRLHDLRHCFASVGRVGHTDLQTIQELLGHTDIATTQRYAHIGNSRLKQASESIGQQLVKSLAGPDDQP